MEFERVLYRVHASTLASLERNRERLHVRPLNACWIVTELTFVVAVSLLLLSTALHASLERGNCLAPQLAEALRVQAPPGSNASDGGWRLPRDVVVKISLGSLPGDAELIAEANEVATRRLSSNGTDAARDDASRWPVHGGDYSLTRRAALLYLEEETFFRAHKVRTVNVTLSKTCLDAGSSLAAWAHRELLGYDTPVINQAMYGLGSSAILRNDATGEVFRWRRSLVKARAKARGGDGGLRATGRWFVFRFGVAAKSLIAFFFMSTITALVIRVLVSSGVVAAFLLWYGLTSCGARLDFGALSLSYPWLGAPLELLRAQRRPACPFVASHVVRVVLLYAAYEACQVAFSDWFYLGQRPLPKTLPLCVFGVALGWEYATMVYVRSAPSIAYLPKLTLLYFLAAHGTFYALARPYALLNLAVAALLMAHAVLYVILEFELPAHARGDVDHETPRARHTELPWPALDAMLPPTWSLFMPLVPDDATVDAFGGGLDAAAAAAANRADAPVAAPDDAGGEADGGEPGEDDDDDAGQEAPGGLVAADDDNDAAPQNDDDNALELVDLSGGDADAAAPILAPSPASSSASSG